MQTLTRNRRRAAWAIAIIADAIQLGLFPITGTLSTWIDKPMDVLVMLVLWRLLGWHLAFLPAFVVELIPYAELTPSWTLAVWLATRGGSDQEVKPGQPLDQAPGPSAPELPTDARRP
jgi:hypothetical protein